MSTYEYISNATTRILMFCLKMICEIDMWNCYFHMLKLEQLVCAKTFSKKVHAIFVLVLRESCKIKGFYDLFPLFEKQMREESRQGILRQKQIHQWETTPEIQSVVMDQNFPSPNVHTQNDISCPRALVRP
jgi:hypothetical protein